MTVQETEFWTEVDRSGGPDACWPWTGRLSADGYGRMRKGNVRAHRRSYELAHGPIPVDRPMICHHCDNKRCVNPRHLYAGTAADNNRDMWARGLGRSGAHFRFPHPMARLTPEQVEEIRAMWPEMTQVEIAAQYGVSQPAISRIVAGKSWRMPA